MNFKVYQNGKEIRGGFVPERFRDGEAGIFETMRTYGKAVFKLEDHLARLEDSARTSGFVYGVDKVRMRHEIKKALELYRGDHGLGDVIVRLTLIRDEVFVMIGERKHSRILYKNGVDLKTSPVKKSLSHAATPEIKAATYQNQVLATLQPDRDVYEWLFLNAQGLVTSVRIGNIFVVKDNRLITPSETGILNGITRCFVIKCASLAGLEVKEAPLMRHEIYNAHEAFLTNTSWEILPVRSLDGRQIGRRVPGPKTELVHRIFKEGVKKECQT